MKLIITILSRNPNSMIIYELVLREFNEEENWYRPIKKVSVVAKNNEIDEELLSSITESKWYDVLQDCMIEL